MFDGYVKTIQDESVLLIRETRLRSGKVLTQEVTKNAEIALAAGEEGGYENQVDQTCDGFESRTIVTHAVASASILVSLLGLPRAPRTGRPRLRFLSSAATSGTEGSLVIR